MAGGFPVGYQLSPFAGSDASAVHGVSVSPSATANVLGPWIELVPSLSRRCSWLLVTILDSGAATVLLSTGVNIGTGTSGSEAVLIQGLIQQRDSTSSVTGSCAQYLLPVCLPAGTRIAAQSQSSGAGAAATYVSVVPFDDAFGSIIGGGAFDTYGYSTSTTRGVQVDPGATTGVNGAYSEVVTSATYDMAGFVLGFDGSTTSGAASIAWTIDVAVGAAGSEVVVLADWPIYGRGTGTTYKLVSPNCTPFLPIPIPAGSRIAVRAQCNQSALATRVFGVSFYGARL